MNKILLKLALTLSLIFFILPFFAFAQTGGPGPQIIWNGAITVDSDGITSGNLTMSGITNPSQLLLIILIDSDTSFNPPVGDAYLGSPLSGNATSGTATFTASGYPAGTFFKPVIIDMGSYTGQVFTLDSCNFMFITCVTGPTLASIGSTGVEITPPPDTGVDIVPPVEGVLQPYIPSSTIKNPLCPTTNDPNCEFDILEFLQKLFANLVKIAIPILVVFMIFSGFLFVEAQGNEEKLANARKNFLYVIIGGALIFGAWTIAMLLKGTVDQFEEPIAFLKLIINLV